MRHKVAGWKLGRTTSHRRSLLRNLATSLILEERIETTVPKAKAMRPHVERLITLAKRGDVAARRNAATFLMTRDSVDKLFNEIGPRFGDREGGYTRIILTGCQVLGVRMAMLGLARLGIRDPRGADRKRLVTFIEIDRCMADAISVVTGCRLGKRALKFRDWGKVAATFCDLQSGRAVRVVARESAKALARERHPELPDKNQQQMIAYRELRDDELFDVREV